MPVALLFVCSQNTCRSAAAEIVFSYLVKETKMDARVDSAGLSAIEDMSPEAGIQQAGQLRGYDLSHLRSRALTQDDFTQFDYLLAVDKPCLQTLRQSMPDALAKTSLLMEYASFFSQQEILYPMENTIAEFSKIFDYVEDACLGLFHHVFD